MRFVRKSEAGAGSENCRLLPMRCSILFRGCLSARICVSLSLFLGGLRGLGWLFGQVALFSLGFLCGSVVLRTLGFSALVWRWAACLGGLGRREPSLPFFLRWVRVWGA